MKPATSLRPCMRERRELEAGDPAFGPDVQSGDIISREAQGHHVVEEGGGLVRGETQIVGADLEQLTTRAQATERQRRIGAARDNQVQLWRQVVEQKGHALVNRLGVDQVVVIEHQQDVLRGGADLIEQGPEHRLDLAAAAANCSSASVLLPISPLHRLERGDDVGPEQRGLIVALVKCEHMRQRPAPASKVASHSASSVVLPKPAGAETRVSLPWAP